MRLPTQNKVTLPYGATYPTPPYSKSNPHAGTDYSWHNGAWVSRKTVVAPETIKIINHGNLGACGLHLEATGEDGRKYRFCHFEQIYVKTGQTVREGVKIAKMGSTGQATGAHLHLVMWVNGKRVNPDKTIKQIIKDEEMHEGHTAKYWWGQNKAHRAGRDKWRKAAQDATAKVKQLQATIAKRDATVDSVRHEANQAVRLAEDALKRAEEAEAKLAAQNKEAESFGIIRTILSKIFRR